MNEALKRAARVEELDKAAALGPWRIEVVDGARNVKFAYDDSDPRRDPLKEHTAEFVAETRTLAPALAADVRAYDAALRELVEAWQDVDSKQDASHGGLREAQRRFDRAIEAAKKVLNG